MDANEVFHHYDTISRRRALTESESRALERAVRQLDRIGCVKYTDWTQAEDEKLMSMKQAGRSYTEIGAALGRSKPSCSYRHRKLTAMATVAKRQKRYAQTIERNEDIIAGRVQASGEYTYRLAKAAGLV